MPARQRQPPASTQLCRQVRVSDDEGGDGWGLSGDLSLPSSPGGTGPDPDHIWGPDFIAQSSLGPQLSGCNCLRSTQLPTSGKAVFDMGSPFPSLSNSLSPPPHVSSVIRREGRESVKGGRLVKTHLGPALKATGSHVQFWVPLSSAESQKRRKRNASNPPDATEATATSRSAPRRDTSPRGSAAPRRGDNDRKR